MRVGAALGIGLGLLLAGCVGGVGGDTPKRPPVSVADEVTTVDRGLIVGSWQCRELNPYPELPQQTTKLIYDGDGTFVGEGRSQARPPFGAMTVNVTGKWAVQGGEIVTSDVKTQAGSEDAFTNLMAGIGSSIANSFGQQAQGAGEVLKLTRHELVFRPAGVEDPPTFSCTR